MDSRTTMVVAAGAAAGFAAGLLATRMFARSPLKTIVRTVHAPAAIGPYNQATVRNDLVFVSGMIALVPDGGKTLRGSTAAEQARQCLTNLSAVLAGAGSSMDKVLKVTVLMTDMDQYAAINAVYSEFFPGDAAPARAAYQVSRLPANALVEIEAIATL